jgi:hypothetical protein
VVIRKGYRKPSESLDCGIQAAITASNCKWYLNLCLARSLSLDGHALSCRIWSPMATLSVVALDSQCSLGVNGRGEPHFFIISVSKNPWCIYLRPTVVARVAEATVLSKHLHRWATEKQNIQACLAHQGCLSNTTSLKMLPINFCSFSSLTHQPINSQCSAADSPWCLWNLRLERLL